MVMISGREKTLCYALTQDVPQASILDAFERPMPLYEPLFRIRKPWHGLAGSSRPPLRPIDRKRRITHGHYAQKVPSAPTGYRNGRKRRKIRFQLPKRGGRSRSHRLMTVHRCETATAPLQDRGGCPPSGPGPLPFPTEAVRSVFLIRLSQYCPSPLFRATLRVNGTDIQKRSRVDVNGP